MKTANKEQREQRQVKRVSEKRRTTVSVHPFVVDFMKRRGMQDVLDRVGSSPEVTMLFDEQYRIKIRTFSADRIGFYASLRPMVSKGPRCTPFIRHVLSISYLLFYKKASTLSLHPGTGMLVLSRDVIAPTRSFDVEEALEAFINDVEFCLEEFKHDDDGRQASFSEPLLR